MCHIQLLKVTQLKIPFLLQTSSQCTIVKIVGIKVKHTKRRVKIIVFSTCVFGKKVLSFYSSQRGALSYSDILTFSEDVYDSFDIVFPERLDKGRMKRDLSTETKVFNPNV